MDCRSRSLNIDTFLAAIAGEEYVLYKSAELDRPVVGSDIDLLCGNVRRVAVKLLTVAHAYFDAGFDVRIEESQTKPVVHIDMMRNGELQVRFDLVEGVPQYHGLRLKRSYFDAIIADRRAEQRVVEGTTYTLYRPAVVDDLVLRYVEYLAWFRTRPDKVKHLDHIFAVTRETPSEMSFVDRLHQFTALPDPGDLREIEVIGGFATRLQHRIKPWLDSLSPRWRRVAELTGRTLVDPVTMFRKLCFRLLATARITHA